MFFLGVPVCLQPTWRDHQVRPELTGPEEIVDSEDGRFRVHFTREGAQAAKGDEEVPELVARVLDGAKLADQIFPEHGYLPFRLDDGGGGSNAIDIYLMYDGGNGTAYREHPADPGIGQSCFITVWPELQDLGPDIVESVTLHELHHCSQYAYANAIEHWIMEAGATYEQYRSLESEVLDLALGALWFQRLNESDRAIDDLDGRYEYAGFILPKFWTELDGEDRSRWPDLYLRYRTETGWKDVFEAEAQEKFGLGFEDLFLEFATWNAFACARDDGHHYLPEVGACTTDATVPVESVYRSFDVVHEDSPFTSAFREIEVVDPASTLTVRCDGPGADSVAALRLVALDDGGSGAETTARANDEDELSASFVPGADRVVAVFVSTGEVPAVHDRCVVDEQPPADDGKACGCTSMNAGGSVLVAFLPVFTRWRARAGARR